MRLSDEVSLLPQFNSKFRKAQKGKRPMSTERERPKLQCTRDYSLFVHSADNRPTELESRKPLLQSMQAYGFVPAFPLAVIRTPEGKLEIRDGQHRFACAQKLGLPVFYVVLNEVFDIAKLNSTQKVWTLDHFAMCFASQGKKDYAEALAFAKQYKIPLSLGASLLGGTVCLNNLIHQFKAGNFRVKSRDKANLIASIYSQLLAISPRIRNARMVEAIYAVCHVANIEHQRLVEGARRCPEKLIAYGTRDAYLSLLEDLYNFGRKSRLAIKIPAENAMRERNRAYWNKQESV